MRRWARFLPHVTFGRTLHTAGDGPQSEVRLPPPRILLIEETPDGYFLIRYTEAGEFAGDTWHATFDEAADQAEFEFDAGRSDWIEVPRDEVDAVAYVRELH
jgi:hypothetical protein